MLLRPWNCPGNSTGVGCHFLLQRIFPTQGSNLDRTWIDCRQTVYCLSCQGSQVISKYGIWSMGTCLRPPEVFVNARVFSHQKQGTSFRGHRTRRSSYAWWSLTVTALDFFVCKSLNSQILPDFWLNPSFCHNRNHITLTQRCVNHTLQGHRCTSAILFTNQWIVINITL